MSFQPLTRNYVNDLLRVITAANQICLQAEKFFQKKMLQRSYLFPLDLTNV